MNQNHDKLPPTIIEAAREVVRCYEGMRFCRETSDAIEALRAALAAQPSQGLPLAYGWNVKVRGTNESVDVVGVYDNTIFVAAQPSREAVADEPATLDDLIRSVHTRPAAPQPEATKPFCAGTNCKATAEDFNHSPECEAEHNRAVHHGAGDRHPHIRYLGYSGHPLPKDANDDQRAAWDEGKLALGVITLPDATEALAPEAAPTQPAQADELAAWAVDPGELADLADAHCEEVFENGQWRFRIDGLRELVADMQRPAAPLATAHPAADAEARADVHAALRDLQAVALWGGDFQSAASRTVTAVKAALAAHPVAGEPAGLSLWQEPKYTVNGSAIVNRASGEAIPADEPVFIFRARDKWAAGVLGDYANFVSDPAHAAAVQERFIQFGEWADAHPERMKEPDTANGAALPAAPAASKGDAA